METSAVEYYTIFNGVFLYKEHELATTSFIGWRERLTAPQDLYNYLRKTYHENFFNSIFIDSKPQDQGSLNTILQHETKKDLIGQPFIFQLKNYPGHDFQISWFDRFLFNDGIGLYGFKVEPADTGNNSYLLLANLIRLLRSPKCQIIIQGETWQLSQLIYQWILPGLLLPPDWDKHVTTLKHYTVVNDLENGAFSEGQEKILFELAHAMPASTVSVQNVDSPTKEYYQKVFSECVIEVYGNWKAIPLLDSFTRLSTQFPDTFRSWELEYYHIYVYCLYIKYQLYHFNDQWKIASQSKKKAALLKDMFVSFLSDFSSPTISYKFLPNLLFEKMSIALETRQEQEMMEKKMNRITEVAESKANVMKENDGARKGSVIVSGFQYDVFISFRPNDNKLGWVTEFVEQLKHELASTLKDPVALYFDKNREDEGHVETNSNSDADGKLNSLILIPIISHTYCDPKCFAWQNEIITFNKLALASDYGRDIPLANGNVASRILPVCIHELEEEDKSLFAEELGMALRPMDFIYREPGVNRPLTPADNPNDNLSKTSYRNQINKIANAIKDIVKGVKKMN